MDESIKSYRISELEDVLPYGSADGAYRIKVVGGSATQTKWLSITDEEMRDIRGILTGDAVNTALYILNREGFAVKSYGAEDVHNVLDAYMNDNTSGVIDTVQFRDEITRHVMEDDNWEGVLDTNDSFDYIWGVVEITQRKYPEWFPKVEEEGPLAAEMTPALVERYARFRTIIACTRGPFPTETAKELETIRVELTKRGIID